MKIGSKIRRLRKLRGLTLESLAESADLTKGFISQVERDMTVPTVVNLKQIVEVLGLDLATFFSGLEEGERNIYSRQERIEEEVATGYRIDSLIPKLRHLEMDPFIVTLNGNGAYQQSFEADEGFGFVLRGQVQVVVDNEKKSLQKGGCFYVFFENEIKIQNLTGRPAEVLFVKY